jgi:hypothetical protein
MPYIQLLTLTHTTLIQTKLYDYELDGVWYNSCFYSHINVKENINQRIVHSNEVTKMPKSK